MKMLGLICSRQGVLDQNGAQTSSLIPVDNTILDSGSPYSNIIPIVNVMKSW